MYWNGAVAEGIIAKLSGIIIPPCIYVATAVQCHGMERTGRDGRYIAQHPAIEESMHFGGRMWSRIIGTAVSKLAKSIAPPGPYVAGRIHCRHVKHTGRHGSYILNIQR